MNKVYALKFKAASVFQRREVRQGVLGRGSAAPEVCVGQERHAGGPACLDLRSQSRGAGSQAPVKEGAGSRHRRGDKGVAHKPGRAPPEGRPRGGD